MAKRKRPNKDPHEKFEDTYGVIRSRKLKRGRQYNEQTKKDQTMIYKKSLKIPKG
jgi:hypothetical protein